MLLSGTCLNDDASRFLPTSAVVRVVVLKKAFPKMMLVGFCIPVRF